MPPRVAPPRRGGRPQPRPTGAGGPVRAPPANAPGIPSAHIETVGVRRTALGSSGRVLEVSTNHFAVKIPEDVIHHYDGASLLRFLSLQGLRSRLLLAY